MGPGVRYPRALHTKFPPFQPIPPIWPLPRVHPRELNIPGENKEPYFTLKVGENKTYQLTFVSLIAVHHLDPSCYQKVLDGCKVGYLDWYPKELEKIETELILIYHHRGLVKLMAPSGATVISVSKRSRHTPKTTQRTHTEPAFSLSQKLFRECINTLSEDNK